MGAKRIILYGADFGYPSAQTHVEGSPAARTLAAADPTTPYLPDGYGRPMRTRADFRNFLRDLETYIAAHPQVMFVNTCRAGAAIAGTIYDEGIDDE
jgi:hypothetical protein